MEPRRFNPSSAHPARAVQAWQILVGKAMNRQTVTYLLLSRLMYGKDAQGVLAAILGHVAYYCADHGLPPLTAIVVGKSRGTPGESIPIDPTKLDELRESVYEHDWYDVHSPSADDFQTAYQAHS
jgi:hypothetical protein